MLVEVQNSSARGSVKKNEILSNNNPLIGGHRQVEVLHATNSLRKAPFFILAKKRMRKRKLGQGC